MDQANAARPDAFQDRGNALDVQLAGHRRVEFARLQRTVADAIQDGAEAEPVEQVA